MSNQEINKAIQGASGDAASLAESALAAAGERDKKNSKKRKADEDGDFGFTATRETIESVLVAFILAFLFRAFIAEAFVIPTGSMASTLMGAHKDTTCPHCGAAFQSTASPEFDPETQALTHKVAVAGTCSICRAVNSFDLKGQANHTTFSGDRILVSKFDYLFQTPKRWDVLVFKYPLDARLNYIKRLVGLPGEHLHIEEGDVFVRNSSDQPWQLARKPAHKVRPMMQVVSDTNHLAKDLIASGWPSLWQPLPPVPDAPANPWQVSQADGKWSANLKAEDVKNGTRWLRYYHKYLASELRSDDKLRAETIQRISPTESTLITDFLAYNTTEFGPRNILFENGRLVPEITSENRARDVLRDDQVQYEFTGQPQDGMHWVGDLAAEFDIQVESDSGTISLDLVEFGIHYTCAFDVGSGKVTLTAVDGDKPLELFRDPAGKAVQPQSDSGIRGRGKHRVTMSNVDDQIFLWLDGRLVTFDNSTAFDSREVRTGAARRPYWTANDPLDAAPIGLGGAGVELKVSRAQVWRDIYYIAVPPTRNEYFTDFSLRTDEIIDSIPNREVRSIIDSFHGQGQETVKFGVALSWWYSQPTLWDKTNLFARRRMIEFEMKEDQFFPMGDNSAASSDARVWSGDVDGRWTQHNYVERRFLIGKALLVFFPHVWMSPVPHPNFARMGLIR